MELMPAVGLHVDGIDERACRKGVRYGPKERETRKDVERRQRQQPRQVLYDEATGRAFLTHTATFGSLGGRLPQRGAVVPGNRPARLSGSKTIVKGLCRQAVAWQARRTCCPLRAPRTRAASPMVHLPAGELDENERRFFDMVLEASPSEPEAYSLLQEFPKDSCGETSGY